MMRTDLVEAIASTALELIEDGIPEDLAIADAMASEYALTVRERGDYVVVMTGFVPAQLAAGDRWVLEWDVCLWLKGEYRGRLS